MVTLKKGNSTIRVKDDKAAKVWLGMGYKAEKAKEEPTKEEPKK